MKGVRRAEKGTDPKRRMRVSRGDRGLKGGKARGSCDGVQSPFPHGSSLEKADGWGVGAADEPLEGGQALLQAAAVDGEIGALGLSVAGEKDA